MTSETPETEIAKELQELSEAASFTMMDMAAWCECDKSAMREWIKHNVTPHPVKQKHLKARLNLLRESIKRYPDKLPVPIQVKQYDRVNYVMQVRNHALEKLSRFNSPVGRL